MSSPRCSPKKARTKKPAGNRWSLFLHLLKILTLGAAIAAVLMDPPKADALRLLRKLIHLLSATL